MYLPDEKSIVGRNLQILINQKNWSIKQAAKELNYDCILRLDSATFSEIQST